MRNRDSGVLSAGVASLQQFAASWDPIHYPGRITIRREVEVGAVGGRW